MAKTWVRIDVHCDPGTAELLAVELAEAFGVSIEFIVDGVRIYLEADRFRVEKRKFDEILGSLPGNGLGPEYVLSEIRDEDWSETWKAHFKPLRVGQSFLITPTWEEVLPGPSDLVIRIDPGRAFGTGHHETTRLCLQWLEKFARQQGAALKRISLLDVGTGSGILAIGGALLGFNSIVGIDNDPEAIEVALENISLNGFSKKIRAFCATPEEVDGEFDMVISNIHSLPLIRMSTTLTAKVRAGGSLALSGILTEQADEVRVAYEKNGLKLAGKSADGEWILLLFEKKEPS